MTGWPDVAMGALVLAFMYALLRLAMKFNRGEKL